MAKVRVKAYTSPTLVLLAFDWPPAAGYADFLGFAVQRTPGFRGAAQSWLTNRLGFDGVPADGGFLPSNAAPIQKFLWWDAQIDTADRGGAFRYAVWPVRGAPGALNLVESARREIAVALPNFVQDGIGTWFNRAVVSSQAFARLLRDMGLGPTDKPSEAQERALRAWLANGLEEVVPDFLATPRPVAGAIYHLQDRFWVIPALAARAAPTDMVYDARPVREGGETRPSPNQAVVDGLAGQNARLKFFPRTKTAIMHNKILVEAADGAGAGAGAARVLCGSANFTSAGLSSQANLMHVFESAELAALFRERVTALQADPAKAATAAGARWSDPVTVGRARVQACFAPEKKAGTAAPPGTGRVAMQPIIDAIRAAKSSVVFCLFSPTDAELRDECFAAGDRGLMMFGLVNRITPQTIPASGTDGLAADKLAAVEIFHRSRDKKDVVGAANFAAADLPAGFLGELKTFPGTPAGGAIPPVIVHHKFVVIDAEGTDPVVFSGSANMSNNAQYNNDENLLQIRSSKALAATYLAEFMRLYEQYRARADWIDRGVAASGAGVGAPPAPRTGFRLAADASWARKHFAPGTPESRARTAMAD